MNLNLPEKADNVSNTGSASASFCICMLSSGSRGNAIYVASSQTSVLIDAGISGIQLERRMKQQGLLPESLDAVVVSHEHTDHVAGVGVMARRYNLPVYITKETRKASEIKLGCINDFRGFCCGTCFNIKDLIFRPFSTSHDAADPAGFTIENKAGKIGIATDLGIATAMVRSHLKGCDLLVLEANHDLGMLEKGPYPWPTKQRIKSRTGHLCNEAAKELLMQIIDPGLKHVILAHISQTNNTPEKALSVIASRLNGHKPAFSTAFQDKSGPVLDITIAPKLI
jgi:phosphoribosyl 1,2-cyclic phosphodiesterase